VLQTPAATIPNTDITGLGTMATQNASAVAITGGSITGLPAPSAANDAATKTYVDSLMINMGKRQRVRVASTANITLSAPGTTIDGVTAATGDLFLAKNQTAPAENGVYTYNGSAVAATRTAEFDTYNEHPGSLIAVAEGTANADTLWLSTSNEGGTLGTTAITFVKLVIAGELLAANNLSDLASAPTARTNLGLAAIAASASASDLTAGTVPAARMPALTGDVTSSAGSVATTIGNTVVTYAKMQNVSATSRFIGRITAGAGAPEELTGTQATTLLDPFTSALKGLVPGSGGGTAKFLRADGSFTLHPAAQTLTDAATIAWDMNSGPQATVTLTASGHAMGAPTNLVAGAYILIVKQDATGSRTMTWNAVFKWPGAVAPTLSTAVNAVDVFSFVSDGTNLYGTGMFGLA
jgi:hypothetical protein